MTGDSNVAIRFICLIVVKSLSWALLSVYACDSLLLPGNSQVGWMLTPIMGFVSPKVRLRVCVCVRERKQAKISITALLHHLCEKLPLIVHRLCVVADGGVG